MFRTLPFCHVKAPCLGVDLRPLAFYVEYRKVGFRYRIMVEVLATLSRGLGLNRVHLLLSP